MLTIRKPTVQQAVAAYVNKGATVFPVPCRSKGATMRGWQHTTIEDCTSLFMEAQSNIGMIWGDASGGLVDVDLDTPLAVKIAKEQPVLPATGWVYGRESSRASHYVYRIEGPVGRIEQFKLGGEMLAEVRGNGHYSLVEPSVHPSGERYEWESPTAEPGVVTWEELTDRVRLLSLICLYASAEVPEGKWHEFSLAVSGLLLKGGAR